MSKILKLTLPFLLLGFVSCNSTTEEKPTAYEMLYQEGYEILYSDTLRFEQKEYVLVALKVLDEDSLSWVSDTEILRPLLILEKQKNGVFDIALRNDKVLLCAACGGVMGDPLDVIEVDGKAFTVSHNGGSRYRWARHTSFAFMEDQNGWFLTSDKGISFDSMNPEGEMSETEHTKVDPNEKIRFETFDINASYND